MSKRMYGTKYYDNFIRTSKFKQGGYIHPIGIVQTFLEIVSHGGY